MNLDQLDPCFCLSGYGYLHDVIQSQGKMIVRIRIFTNYDMASLTRDEVWLDCEVISTHQQTQLLELIQQTRTGQCVMINFKAEYSGFKNAYSGLAPNDPNYIVSISSKLCSLDQCYVNDRQVEKNIFQPRVIA